MGKHIAILLLGINSLLWSSFSSSEGVIKDTNTHLEWQNNFRGDIPELSWDKAVSYCENLSLKGEEWRLPNKEELVSIVDKEKKKPAIDSVFLNKSITEFDYWSSTADADNNLRWGINFYNGWTGMYSAKYHLKVRCVRGSLAPKIVMAETFNPTPESEPFQEETSTIIVILGNPTPIELGNIALKSK